MHYQNIPKFRGVVDDSAQMSKAGLAHLTDVEDA
jgi:hypothetical protein